MRSVFAKTLCELAAADERIWLITGDLGYNVLEPFADRFPRRFVNAGVAEQNMLGFASGLALSGCIPFVYSIVNFPVMRGLEQIRNDIAYHNLPVKLVTVGGGLVYGAHGYSHHGAEDVGVMRLLPHMTVVIPADGIETAWATRKLAARPGPAYLRLGRGGEPDVHGNDARTWEIGEPVQVRHGGRVTVAASGPLVKTVLEVDQSCSADIFSVPTVQPLDLDSLLESARASGSLLTIEDHGRGGLGTIIAEAIAERGERFRFQSMHYAAESVTMAGSNEFLRAQHGVGKEMISAAIDRLAAH